MSLRNENAGGVDLPPEYCQYNDDGCEFGGSCLNCHLPICIYDEPGGKQRFLKRKRALEMARLFSSEGKSVKELAGIFDVSTRTVQRALKAVRSDRTNGALLHKSVGDKQNHLSLEGRGTGEGEIVSPSPESSPAKGRGTNLSLGVE